MADTATEIPLSVEETVIESLKNATGRPVNSVEGIAVAYLSLVVMAILPIFFGSYRSVKYLKEQKVSGVTCWRVYNVILSHVFHNYVYPIGR